MSTKPLAVPIWAIRRSNAGELISTVPFVNTSDRSVDKRKALPDERKGPLTTWSSASGPALSGHIAVNLHPLLIMRSPDPAARADIGSAR
jgi:hypothetical protein